MPMKLLRLFGVVCYALSTLLGGGLVVNFVVSIFRWDFSPWWFWPAGFGMVFLLIVIAGIIFRLGEKKDR